VVVPVFEGANMASGQHTPLHLSDEPFAQEYGLRLRAVAHYLEAQIATFTAMSPEWSGAVTALLAQPRGILASTAVRTGNIVSPDDYLFALHALLAFEMAARKPGSQVTRKQWEVAIPLAAAWDILGSTLDLFDDIQDDDRGLGETYPKELAISAAIGGIGLALHMFTDARLLPPVCMAVLHSLGTTLFMAAEGQFLDGFYEHAASVTLNESLRMTSLKSGSLIKGLYQQCALAGATTHMPLAQAQKLAAASGDFGQALGEYWQLINDGNDAAPDSIKSDRPRGKKTVPLAMEAHIPASATAEQKWQAGLMTTMLALSLARHRAYEALQVLAQQYTLDVERLQWTVAEEQGEDV
jgi:geranylgeranyl pyrophosphate synthase